MVTLPLKVPSVSDLVPPNFEAAKIAHRTRPDFPKGLLPSAFIKNAMTIRWRGTTVLCFWPGPWDGLKRKISKGKRRWSLRKSKRDRCTISDASNLTRDALC
jgi:hypothetical protein